MAESELKDCPCTNITIMQLFHELKQKYPKIPDQIVSKVIEQNFHDKTACETILQRESHYFLQSYPGAIISGNARDHNGPLCRHCPISRKSVPPLVASKNEVTTSNQGSCKHVRDLSHPGHEKVSKKCNPFTGIPFGDPNWTSETNMCSDKNNEDPSHSEGCKAEMSPLFSTDRADDSIADSDDVLKNKASKGINANLGELERNDSYIKNSKLDFGPLQRSSDQSFCSSSSLDTNLGSFSEDQKDSTDSSSGTSAVISDGTFVSGCESETREENLSSRSQSYTESSSPGYLKNHEIETRRWCVEDGGRKSAVITGIISNSPHSRSPSTHNYQVAVECSMQPIPPDCMIPRDHTRSFTSVNLCLRPPSSEPQPPIEIQSGQGLTYTTSSFDPNKGYQSQLQIRIDPALLEKQRERKDLLCRELRREKEKLRFMRNEVKLMKAAIAQRPNPHILPKLKTEILRLRTECERLTAAVDLYSGGQNNLPLGETDEEFYRNIYTGQSFQREGSWSCQLCTFQNHPLLSVCEECGMPRLPLGTAVEDTRPCLPNVFPNSNNTSFCTGAGTSSSASLMTAPLQER